MLNIRVLRAIFPRFSEGGMNGHRRELKRGHRCRMMRSVVVLRRASSALRNLQQWSFRHFSYSRSFSSAEVNDLSSVDGGNGDTPHVPVLIVGAGPVGLVLSMLLTKLGVKCAVLEKNISFSQHPQAHFLNNRTMEIFRKLDGLANEIQRLQPPVNLWRKFVYCSSLCGPVFGSVDHMQQEESDKVVSPVSVAHFSQHKLTRLLIVKLENMGFRVSGPGSLEDWNQDLDVKKTIFMGHECISVNPNANGVKVEALFAKEGNIVKRNICCSILVGSDGSKSTVRKLVGIKMSGERDLQKLLSVHFISQDLGQYLLKERPGMLFFIFNPRGIGVLVAHDLNQGEFVLQIPFYPPQQKFEDFTSTVCEDIISNLVGRLLKDIEIIDVKPWVMHAEVAEKYISSDGRVILVGDAAHRFPPAGGFGMNTGIQDSHNLAWKIVSLFDGISSPSILETYELERRPVAIFNTKVSIKNFEAAMSVPSALGLDPKIANTVHQSIDSGLATILPSGFQKFVFESIMAVGRAQLSEAILSEANPFGAYRLAKVRRILNSGQSLQLQFPAEDLGFRYLSGALVQELDEENKDVTEQACSRTSRGYIPSAKPGSRLPYMSMKPLCSSSCQDLSCTLDLISGDKVVWLLLIAPRKISYNLAHAAAKVAKDLEVPLKVCIVWQQGSFSGGENRSGLYLESWIDFVDLEEVQNPSMPKTWWEICQMTNEGAILVRPDEHIAWREKTVVDGDLNSKMEMILSLVSRKQI